MAETPVISDKITDEDFGESLGINLRYKPTEGQKLVVGNIFEKFRTSRQERNMTFEYLDGRNLIDYIDDNVSRFVTNIDAREDIEDWQARVFDPFTRNKVVAILGKVATAIPKPEFINRGDADVERTTILSDFYDYSEQVDDGDELMFYALLEAVVKGTCIGYEGYQEKEREVADIAKYDGASKIRTKKGTNKTRKVVGMLVPLEDFFPSSVGIRKITDMPYCFWRSIITDAEFRASFAGYEFAESVEPYNPILANEENRPFYLDYVSDDIAEGEVELIRYYNQDTDEFVILANGVWLNPLDDDSVMPIPFAHKSLPFWKAIYEPFGADFFYGKSLPDKLKSMQDVINVLHNMMLDQSFLSIFPPILTSGFDDIEDDFLRPGRRIPVTDANNYKELAISSPNSFHQFILTYTKRVLEETSVDAVSQGIAGAGDRVTATEIERAANSVASILGLFVQFVKWGVRDKARLRAKNILQFYSKPLYEAILGEGGAEDVNKAFNTFRLDDVVLSKGKRGTKIIDVYKSREALPTRVALKTQARFSELETGKKEERIAINAGYI
ncbi:MAG TPA: hypothetical protein ENI23_11685, partial [bacterium]|nr:hypothetical protein [bacterium]